jgi:hypothetical protein
MPALSLPVAVLAIAVAALGLALRLWLLYHRPLNGDQAIVGLMADQIRHGHMFTFYWGQPYGGVEPYLAAAWTALVGGGPVALDALPTVLAAVSVVLLWRIGRRLVTPRYVVLAGAAALAFWVWPEVVVFNSTREQGFRGAAMTAGLGMLFLAVRLRDTGSRSDAALLGLVAGIGWWASPEIVYFMLPAGLLVAGRPSQVRTDPLRTLLLVGAGGVIGALPWLATNFRTGFASLRLSSSPEYVHATYLGRLSVFVRKTLPMVLGLRIPLSGAWVGGRLGEVMYVVAWVVGAAVAVQVVRMGVRRVLRGEVIALVAGVFAFPFLYAAFPATSYWQEGQYCVYLVPLLILVVVAALGTRGEAAANDVVGGARARPFASAGALAAVVVIGAGALGVTSFDKAWLAGHPGRFLADWGSANTAAELSVQRLERAGIHDAYGQYWVAYDLDYLSGTRLAVADPAIDRWVAGYYRVLRSADPAWIFFSPSGAGPASVAFSSGFPGPNGLSEPQFLGDLRRLGIGWRIDHAGVLDAVVPSAQVVPEEVGIGSPMWH